MTRIEELKNLFIWGDITGPGFDDGDSMRSGGLYQQSELDAFVTHMLLLEILAELREAKKAGR